MRPIYALPVGLTWPNTSQVTLLGDAAHLMSPFAGEGVNLAMADGLELGLALLENPENIDLAFAKYEDAMYLRSATMAAESDKNLRLAFADDSPVGFVRLLESYGGGSS